MHQRTSPEGPNFGSIKFRYVRGSLRPDRGCAGGAEGQIHGSPELHRSISARSGIRLPFNRRERQDKEERWGGGETDSKVLGVYGGDTLNENGKLLLGFAEDNKLALLNTFFCTPKSGVSYTFQNANRSKGQARLFGLYSDKQSRRTADSSAALMSPGPP